MSNDIKTYPTVSNSGSVILNMLYYVYMCYYNTVLHSEFKYASVIQTLCITVQELVRLR